MPVNETVWTANVWEHTRCLAACGFLLRLLCSVASTPCLLCWLELCEGGCHCACLAQYTGPGIQVIWSGPRHGGCGPSLGAAQKLCQ